MTIPGDTEICIVSVRFDVIRPERAFDAPTALLSFRLIEEGVLLVEGPLSRSSAPVEAEMGTHAKFKIDMRLHCHSLGGSL
jgi:hypothetical protein